MGTEDLEFPGIQGCDLQCRVLGEVPLEDDGMLMPWPDDNPVASHRIQGGDRAGEDENNCGKRHTEYDPKDVRHSLCKRSPRDAQEEHPAIAHVHDLRFVQSFVEKQGGQ